MVLDFKYVILYVGAGVAARLMTKGDKTSLLIGLGVSAIFGSSFGFFYAIISAIEFWVGFAVASVFHKNSGK